ncbi:glycoside hydrolase family 88 protein [Algoriphagus sp. D3-2-R+10]|uniref:glycoside hydrolase family 88 protein n=1 Tax=Algoriphagus aurantiacus TaxID=3103948 RepID=UPI002B3A6696|nr:glycoside hydrolase family 88 protein [Algoriphagus sp. D3-2-R+10]MEB2774694.1 glycoside hydrolase family 88 protein [Algoriphagus sp. D3-2-R+10]
MKKLLFLCLAVCLLASSCKSTVDLSVSKSMKNAESQLNYSLKNHTDKSTYPRSVKPDGSLNAVPSRDWTSGFYPGSMWHMYDYTNDQKWADTAAARNAGLESVKFNTHTHDLGFVLYCSFGNGLKLTENPKYAQILLQGAQTLIKRFDPKIGSIRSWDFAPWEYPVIIDNMMNLEMLFWATKYSGDSTFYDIAVKHADTSLKNHYRPDFSSYHVVDYDTITGNVKAKKTHQGFSDDSAWARGQAWGLYGFTMVYRETGDKKYLEQAEKIADFYLNHPNLPEDMIPYWDFNAPNIPNESRDASAAAIAASGLLELSRYSKDGSVYFDAAEKMLTSLSSPVYLAKPGTNQGFILMHSTGHKPNGSEIDTPINYADYYYLEALLRYKMLTPNL